MQFNDTQEDFYQLNYEWYKSKLKQFNSTPEYQAELNLLSDMMAYELPSIRTVLDYGCGTGYAMRYLAPDLDVYGYDRFCYYEGNLSQFNQSGITFDSVYFMHSINHIPDLSQAIQNINDQLKSGGFVIIITPDPKYLPKNYKPDPTVIKYLSDDDLKQTFYSEGYILRKNTKINHPMTDRKYIHRMMLIFQKQ